jgi:mRNA interferase RelE/StbE
MSETPAYQVIITRQAEKLLRRLPKDLLKRFDRAILELAHNPRPVGCKKLVGYENLYRIREGDWRIIYAIEDERLVVLVLEVASRGSAYRNLRS